MKQCINKKMFDTKKLDKEITKLFSKKQELARLDYTKKINKKSYNHKIKNIDEQIISLTDKKKDLFIKKINYKLSQEVKDGLNKTSEKKEVRGRKKLPYKKRILKIMTTKSSESYEDISKKVLKYYPEKNIKDVSKDVRYIVSQIRKGGTKKYGIYKWNSKNFKATIRKK